MSTNKKGQGQKRKYWSKEWHNSFEIICHDFKSKHYPTINDADPIVWGWEFLRRNVNFIKDYFQLKNEIERIESIFSSEEPHLFKSAGDPQINMALLVKNNIHGLFKKYNFECDYDLEKFSPENKIHDDSFKFILTENYLKIYINNKVTERFFINPKDLPKNINFTHSENIKLKNIEENKPPQKRNISIKGDACLEFDPSINLNSQLKIIERKLTEFYEILKNNNKSLVKNKQMLEENRHNLIRTLKYFDALHRNEGSAKENHYDDLVCIISGISHDDDNFEFKKNYALHKCREIFETFSENPWAFSFKENII